MSHRAEIKAEKSRASDDTAGSDAALATLTSTLASLKQEKEAKQVNITKTFIPPPKSRYDAARKEKLMHKNSRPGLNSGARPANPHVSTISPPHLGAAPTSAPTSEEDLKLRAMKTPVVHLLAIEAVRSEEIANRTHIPKEDLEDILRRVGKQDEACKWHLSDKAYKDLDVFQFDYPSEEQRQAAINNAARAYDRMRIEKGNQLWQLLLPKEERGKGKTLSRLHLEGGQVNRGLTPSHQPSPMLHVDYNNDSRAASVANTPKMGPSTPRPGSSTGDVKKRLLAKDPQKARAAENAKEKKRKEREVAASDREGGKPAKKQATKKANVKSEEIVYSSDDESDDEPIKPKAAQRVQSSPEKEKAKPTPKAKSKAASSTSPDSSDTALKDKAAAKPTAKPKPAARPIDPPETKAKKPTTTGKATPQAANNLSAPNSQQRTQRSPSNPGNRPSIPSPLGAERPRVASDVSDKTAVGVQKIRQSADASKGLGITNGVKKTQENAVKAGFATSNKTNNKSDDIKSTEQLQKGSANGTETRKPLVNGTSQQANAGVKRKAEESASQQEGGSTPKLRKMESTSAEVHKPQSKPDSTPIGTDNISPEGPFDAGSGSDGVDSVLDSINEHFEKYFPAYSKEYDAQEAMMAKGEKVSKEDKLKLLEVHESLGRMLKEYEAASDHVKDSVFEGITHHQGVEVAKENYKKYYPAYSKEYDAQEAMIAKGEKVSTEDRLKLLEMHKKLARVQQESEAASDDAVDSVLESITYNQGVKVAENLKKYAPAYEKEYDAQEAMIAKGEEVSREDRLKLLEMHKRLKRMLKEIWVSSEREFL